MFVLRSFSCLGTKVSSTCWKLNLLATIGVPLDCDPERHGHRPTRIAAASLVPIVEKWMLNVSAIDFGSVSETPLASILDGVQRTRFP